MFSQFRTKQDRLIINLTKLYSPENQKILLSKHVTNILPNNSTIFCVFILFNSEKQLLKYSKNRTEKEKGDDDNLWARAFKRILCKLNCVFHCQDEWESQRERERERERERSSYLMTSFENKFGTIILITFLLIR